MRILRLRRQSTLSVDKRSIPDAMRNPNDLYQRIWHEHFARIARAITQPGDRLLAVASDLGTRKRRGAFHVAVDEAVRASAQCTHRVAFWPNMSEPCLVVADYCTWAIQRKWERNDSRSQILLQDKISSETEIEVSGKRIRPLSASRLHGRAQGLFR